MKKVGIWSKQKWKPGTNRTFQVIVAGLSPSLGLLMWINPKFISSFSALGWLLVICLFYFIDLSLIYWEMQLLSKNCKGWYLQILFLLPEDFNVCWLRFSLLLCLNTSVFWEQILQQIQPCAGAPELRGGSALQTTHFVHSEEVGAGNRSRAQSHTALSSADFSLLWLCHGWMWILTLWALLGCFEHSAKEVLLQEQTEWAWGTIPLSLWQFFCSAGGMERGSLWKVSQNSGGILKLKSKTMINNSSPSVLSFFPATASIPAALQGLFGEKNLLII